MSLCYCYCVTVFMSFSLLLSQCCKLCHRHCVTVTLQRSLSHNPSAPVSLSLCHCHCVDVTITVLLQCVTVHVTLSLCHCPFVTVPVCLLLCPCHCNCVDIQCHCHWWQCHCFPVLSLTRWWTWGPPTWVWMSPGPWAGKRSESGSRRLQTGLISRSGQHFSNCSKTHKATSLWASSVATAASKTLML